MSWHRVRGIRMVAVGLVPLLLAVTLLACAGKDGKDGVAGTAGASGTSGTNGTNGSNGSNGANGSNCVLLTGAPVPAAPGARTDPAAAFTTAHPIKHLVVIFQENVSFDHYFGTYPTAVNGTPCEPAFVAASGTPKANTLATPLVAGTSTAVSGGPNLLTANPNYSNAANFGAAPKSATAVNPFRLSRSQAATQDQDHAYTDEQKAFNNGAMDLFPATVGVADTGASSNPLASTAGVLGTTSVVLGYYDGNTVTAIWNYAQHFAMNDNSYGTTFGPSAPGAINLVAGQTHGIVDSNAGTAGKFNPSFPDVSDDGHAGASLVGDAQPLGDACSTRDAVRLGGQNVGDLLNAQNISWGFFQGGFDLTVVNADGSTGCSRTTTSLITGVKKTDYIPHHQPFQYYASTSNPTHARPASVAAIGQPSDTVAKHQYDLHDFFDAVSAGNFPAVNFLKAPGYQDGHAQYSDPLDEQVFLAEVINFLQQQPEWSSTAVVILYDDSDGWYDHQMPPIVNPSLVSALTATIPDTAAGTPQSVVGLPDGLNGVGLCNPVVAALQGITAPTTSLAGYTGTANVQGRCGYGPRMPLLVLSPYAKANTVDHTLTDQTSVLKFIEDNWLGSTRITGSFDAIAGTLDNLFNYAASGSSLNPKLYLDPTTGVPFATPPACTNCF